MKLLTKILNVAIICLIPFPLLISCNGKSQSQKNPDTGSAISQGTDKTSVKHWKLVSSQGNIKFVYVEPDIAHDRILMAQILQAIVGQKGKIIGPVQVMFFDNKSETPVAFPMTDSQMIHQVATYNYNPNNGFEEFVWITILDSKTSPPRLATKKDNISPGIAR